jgi:signal recognition particle subunit SRP54
MLEGLIDQFQLIRRKILGYGRITEHEISVILKDIRISLLEADVNYKVVKAFIHELSDKCAGLHLERSLRPGDIVVKTVYEEMIELLGGQPRQMEFKTTGPLIISLIGLQGVGKTTTAAKLGTLYKKKNPLLVPADAKRPAAFEQLAQLGKRAGIPVQPLIQSSPKKTVEQAIERAREKEHMLIIIDTAGRLHLDDTLISELRDIHGVIEFDYRLLVADGMSGQDAVNQAVAFQDKIGLDGAILTKMDGDARGGAALSITRAAKVPIFFIGTSETLQGLEQFFPDRMAQRIMGMGDLTSLVEKVKGIEKDVDDQEMRAKVMKGELNFEDFLAQLKAVKKLGPLSKLAAMMPGVKENDIKEDELKRIEAIINSMTKDERLYPDKINGSRKRRIAAGSGTTMRDVNQLLKQFFYARDLLKKMGRGKLPKNMPFKIQ